MDTVSFYSVLILCTGILSYTRKCIHVLIVKIVFMHGFKVNKLRTDRNKYSVGQMYFKWNGKEEIENKWTGTIKHNPWNVMV